MYEELDGILDYRLSLAESDRCKFCGGDIRGKNGCALFRKCFKDEIANHEFINCVWICMKCFEENAVCGLVALNQLRL